MNKQNKVRFIIAFAIMILTSLTMLTACDCSGFSYCNHEWLITDCYQPKVCKLCGVVGTSSNNHIMGDWAVAKEPTCQEEGEKQQVCTVCGAVLKTAPIQNTTVHTAGEWIVDKAPTCVEKGSQHTECTVCGKLIEVQEIEKSNDHVWDDGACKLCGEILRSSVYALNSDKVSYSYVDIGNVIATDIVIADTYNGLPVTTIGDSAFAYCSGLTSVVIPNSVTSIGDYAFEGCSGLTSVVIPNSVTSIVAFAFAYCSGLTSVVIPNSVTWISNYAFVACDKLVEVINYSNLNITKGSTDYGRIGYNALNVKTSGTTDIVNKDGYLFYTYNNVNYLLGYSGSDTNLVLPDSYNGQSYQIYNSAFEDCSGLTSVVIPDSVTTIGDYAFDYCSRLTSVVIGNNVTSIGDRAFSSCRGLTSVVIGNSVTSIGNYAFNDCYKLVEVINYSRLNITKGSEGYGDIGYNALNVKTSGTTDIVNKDGYLFLTVDNVNYLVNYIGTDINLVLPDSYNGQNYKIYNCAFRDCGLISVVIPNSVTTIGEDAFRGCNGLTSVVIPNSVTTIGEDAFGGCHKLVEVIDYSSLKIIKGSEDYGDVGYYALNVKTSGTTDIVNKNGYLFYTYNNVNYLLGYSGTDTNLVLPDSYNGQKYEIYEYAFDNCTSLRSVVIPDSVTSIGYMAFGGCKLLTSVVIGNSVTSIGDSAFHNCSKLTSVVIPNSITTIGDRAFHNCDRLTNVVIGNSVTTIGDRAFCNCIGLTSVVIGNSVTTIGDSAFSSCSGLTSVVIPNSVTKIGNYAFNGCSGLTSVVIPNSVTNIGNDAFSCCSKLTSVVIPNSVTTIGDRAFSGCSELRKVYYNGTANDWNNITIGSSNSDLTNTTRYYYSETQPTDSGNYWHYDEKGNIVEW